MSLPLGTATQKTPYVVFDTGTAIRAYKRIVAAMPGIAVHYATKCQPDPVVCAALAAAGARFEIASSAELAMLIAVGVDPPGLVCSHPAAPDPDISAMASGGVSVYAVDSLGQLTALAAAAPGSQVMVRLATSTAGTTVPSEGKFGVDPDAAVALMVSARAAGLWPTGITWHVGSQCTDPAAWGRAIEAAGQVMRRLADHDIRVHLLDLGGGFPACYDAGSPPPPIEVYGQVIRAALASRLPYPVRRVICEPGRAIAAEAGTMVATVNRTAERGGRMWAHLDAGAFHGLIEALETRCSLPWPVADSRRDTARRAWTLTGPSCDGQDTVAYEVQLSAKLQPGDRVMIGCAGAYTTAYSSGAFNGFCSPELLVTRPEGSDDDDRDRARTTQASAAA